MPVANVHIGLSDTELTVMTEAEVAWMRAKEGDTVVQRDGRHWWTTFPGFYQPIHLLARLRAAEIRRPALLCCGDTGRRSSKRMPARPTAPSPSTS
jgi:hypothetical protein